MSSQNHQHHQYNNNKMPAPAAAAAANLNSYQQQQQIHHHQLHLQQQQPMFHPQHPQQQYYPPQPQPPQVHQQQQQFQPVQPKVVISSPQHLQQQMINAAVVQHHVIQQPQPSHMIHLSQSSIPSSSLSSSSQPSSSTPPSSLSSSAIAAAVPVRVAPATSSVANIQHNVIKEQPQQPITSMSVYMTLTGMAESFQQSGQYRLCIHCLESILILKPNDITVVMNFHNQLRTRLNLCRIYLKHTVNTNQYVNAHLEKSMILVQNLNANDEYKYEATYIIYKIFQKQKEHHSQLKLQQQQSSSAAVIDASQLTSLFNLDLIRHTMETSKIYPVWHFRLLFLMAEILMAEKDFSAAAFYMSLGIEFCTQNRGVPAYTHILFILCKGLIHLLQRNPNDLQVTMQPCAALIEGYQTNNVYQLESLKIFFLVLQVTYFLQCGQMKSVRNTLKSLQHYIQSLTSRPENSNDELMVSSNQLENFHWMSKDHLGILVYLLTVIHSVQTGAYDKAQKFCEKAFLNLQKLKLKESAASPSSSSSFLTNSLNMLLLEYIVRCSISLGNRTLALKHIGNAFQLCEQSPRLFQLHAPQLHCLLGCYALSVNAKDAAIIQFNQALNSTQDTELWLYCAMNLALCYLATLQATPSNKTQLLSILDNLLPEKIQTQNTALTACAHYFKALKFFLSGHQNYPQSLESLREAILLSNAEELTSISSSSLIFMGHVQFLSQQFQESFTVLVNGNDLADRMPDVNLKSYGTAMLKTLYKYFNDPRETEVNQKSIELEQQISADIFEAQKMHQHALINWTGSAFPSQLFANIQRSISSSNLAAAAMPVASSTTTPIQTAIVVATNSPNNHHHQHHQQQQSQLPQQQQQRIISNNSSNNHHHFIQPQQQPMMSVAAPPHPSYQQQQHQQIQPQQPIIIAQQQQQQLYQQQQKMPYAHINQMQHQQHQPQPPRHN